MVALSEQRLSATRKCYSSGMNNAADRPNASWFRRYRFVARVFLLLVLLSWSAAAQESRSAGSVTVYKSPSCGCCSKWIDHMRANGFEMTAHNVEDIAAVKAKHGVPAQAASCHTSLVGGYVIEGHVPADVIKRLLRERPKVSGLAVPGMPMGSPGMEVPSGQKDSYAIVSFDASGRQTLVERR